MRFASIARSSASIATAGLIACSLTACVVAPRQAPMQPVAVQQVQRADTGRVAHMELVRTEERPQASGAGAVIGGLAGAVLGHQIGGGNGRSAATVLGAVGGAIAGNSIENSRQTGQLQESYRVTVHADDGTYRYFSVPTQTDLRVGDRVRMANGQLFR